MSTRIVVVGAGYAGLLAAISLSREKDLAVTLINSGDRFSERVRLHQLASGQRLRDRPLSSLLTGTGVDLVTDTVLTVESEPGTLHTARGTELAYDVLVLATGSTSGGQDVPGVTDFAYSVADQDSATRLRTRLTEGADTVTVVGGGLTGIETATEIAESFPATKVRLLTSDTVGAALSRRGRGHVHTVLDRLGVELREAGTAAELRADSIVLTDGLPLPSDVVVWCTGFRASDLARRSGLAVDERDRLLVDATLRSRSHPGVYGIGDAAALVRHDGLPLRMSCATSLPAGAWLARVLTDRLRGREPRPLRFRYLNQCISLGRRDALVQYVRQDDTPVETVLTGRTAALYKEAIVRGAVLVQRHPGVVSWIS